MLKAVVLSLALAAAMWQSQSAALTGMYKSVHALIWVVRDLDTTVAGWRKLGFTDIRIFGDVTVGDSERGLIRDLLSGSR